MTAFLELVQIAFFDTSTTNRRKEAEQQILAMKETSLDQLMQTCAQEFANKQTSLHLRQACATLLKRLMVLKDEQSDQSLWLRLQPQTKQNIKTFCLSELIDQDIQIKRSAANVISEICAVELPRQEWPDIVNNLVNNTKMQDVNIKMSAVMTLGYICETMKTNKQTGIPDVEAQKILFGICLGMDKQETSSEIRSIALKALQDSLYFMNEQFQKPEIRDYVKNLLIENSISQDLKIRMQSLQCMIDFCKQLFNFIGGYLQDIYQATALSFEADQSVAIPAMEVWTVIGNEIKERKENSQMYANTLIEQQTNLVLQFLHQINQTLIVSFMKNLLQNDSSDEDDNGGLSVQQSAYKALSIVVELIGQPTHEQLTTFISNTILSQQWQHRKASVMAFSALAEGNNNETVRALIFSALNTVVNLLEDQNARVKLATAQALSRVAENYAECFICHAQAKLFLTMLLKALNNKFKISSYIVWTLVYITENLQKFTNSPFFSDKFTILQNLASMAVRQDIGNNEYSLIDTSFMGILNIMYLVTNAQECKQFLMEFQQQLLSTQQMERERAAHIRTGLLTTMHGCLVRLGPEDLSEIETEVVYKAIRNSDLLEVSSDSLYALSGLASAVKKRFAKYCDEIIQILNQTLQKPEDFETFKTSLFCLADIARALEDDFIPYLPIMNYLLGLIKNPQFNRELKLHVYTCISDIVMATREKSVNYLPDVKGILLEGFKGCVLLSDSGSPENFDYADRLKEILVSAYTCLLHSYCDENGTNNHLLAETIQWIFQFCEKMCDKRLKPTLEFAKSSLNAIMDIANFYQNSQRQFIYGFITGPFVLDLINTLNRFKDDQEYKECIEYAGQLLQQYGYKIQMN